MREIFFRGFEIAVKDGGTRGIMSSFNRLGATNDNESSALLTTVLRNEWGFRGTVITDCILQLGYTNIDRAVRAGNDLILSLMNIQSVKDTSSASAHVAMRQAAKNILYTAANGIGQELATPPVVTWLYALVGVVDVLLIALVVFWFVRRAKKMKLWKAAQK